MMTIKNDKFDPQPGDIVCDCRYRHLIIVERDDDDLILEDGSQCSLIHCCDPPDHLYTHPNLKDSKDNVIR